MHLFFHCKKKLPSLLIASFIFNIFHSSVFGGRMIYLQVLPLWSQPIVGQKHVGNVICIATVSRLCRLLFFTQLSVSTSYAALISISYYEWFRDNWK